MKKKSIYYFDKEWKVYSDFPLIKNIGRKMSLWDMKYKDRVFNKNMINGLCYGKFYGRQKILFKRKNSL